jgi:protein-disulfide isomerase
VPSIPLPRHSTPGGDGIGIGVGLVAVDVYLDFQCHACKQFELATLLTLLGLISEQSITMLDHPLNLLDGVSGNGYSTRAAAAAAAADDYGAYPEYGEALLINQPEGGEGLSDNELVDLGHELGITDPGFAEAVHHGRYLPWPSLVTECAIRRGIAGTPSVLVSGRAVAARPAAIVMAVRAALE